MGEPARKANCNRLVQDFVARKIRGIEESYMAKSPSGARHLAELRRGVGKRPGETPETWALEFEGLPAELLGRGPEPSWGEWAVHASLTLYAVHQQSQSERMYVPGRENGFGCAVRKLTDLQGESSELEYGQMPRRLTAFVTAQSIEELAHYGRQLVTQLRSKSIPVDYGRLARQIYLFQSPGYRSDVCLEWAREYARTVTEPSDSNDDGKSADDSRQTK